MNCNDDELNSIIYANRAQCHIIFKNYGHAINDCKQAIKYNQYNFKAYIRAVECSKLLQKYKQVKVYCQLGLAAIKKYIEPNVDDEIEKYLTKEAKRHGYDDCNDSSDTDHDHEKKVIITEQGEEEQDEKIDPEKHKLIIIKVQKNISKVNKIKNMSYKKLNIYLKENEIYLQQLLKKEEAERKEEKLLEKYELILKKRLLWSRITKAEFDLNSAPNKGQINLDSYNNILWQVMFLIPQVEQAEFIQNFNEITSIKSNLSLMFPPKTSYAPWDKQHQFTIKTIKVYYISLKTNEKVYINTKHTLKKILDYDDFPIKGVPTFYLETK